MAGFYNADTAASGSQVERSLQLAGEVDGQKEGERACLMHEFLFVYFSSLFPLGSFSSYVAAVRTQLSSSTMLGLIHYR